MTQDNHTGLDQNPQDDFEALQERRSRAAKRANQGVMWVGVGTCILGLSFLINLLFFFSSDQFTILMYIMTTLGSICLVKGMWGIFN